MQLPAGMANVKPADSPAGRRTVGGRVITWTGGRIPQGETGEFEISGAVPQARPGKMLEFPVVRTYARREGRPLDRRGVVGHACSHDPAHGGRAAPPPPPPPPPAATTPTTTDDRCQPRTTTVTTGRPAGSSGLRSLVGLIAAGAALLWRRRALRRALVVAGVLACLLAPGAEAHFGTAKLGLPLDDRAVEAAMRGAAAEGPVRRRPGLARQPQRQDGRHRRATAASRTSASHRTGSS